MSVINTKTVNTIDDKNLVNENNLNDTTKISENRESNENSKRKTTTIMPAATHPMDTTVTVLNSNEPYPPSEPCSDSEEEFDPTTRNLGAHKWNSNVSSTNSIFFQK